MTDRYENIRKALEMGPTPGPWKVWDDVIYYDNGNFQVLRHFITSHEADVVGAYGIEADDRPSANANAAHIAACDPDTIRALLAERDALARDAERLDWLAEGFRTCTVYMGGDHPWTPGHKVRSLHGPSFRAAIDQARGKESGSD